jgi:hypothetical protein
VLSELFTLSCILLQRLKAFSSFRDQMCGVSYHIYIFGNLHACVLLTYVVCLHGYGYLYYI